MLWSPFCSLSYSCLPSTESAGFTNLPKLWKLARRKVKKSRLQPFTRKVSESVKTLSGKRCAATNMLEIWWWSISQSCCSYPRVKLVWIISSDFCELISCHVNCSADQEKFMTEIYEKEVNIGGDKFNATFIDTNLRNSDSCAIFTSCWKSPLFQSLQSTKTLRGFMKFFAEGSLSQGNPDEPENTSCSLKRPSSLQLQHHRWSRNHDSFTQFVLWDSVQNRYRRLRLSSRSDSNLRLWCLPKVLQSNRLGQNYSQADNFHWVPSKYHLLDDLYYHTDHHCYILDLVPEAEQEDKKWLHRFLRANQRKLAMKNNQLFYSGNRLFHIRIQTSVNQW